MRSLLAVIPSLLLVGTGLSAQPVAAPAVPAATDQSQEIVCRKEKETGSLVKKKKTCHSRAQWAYIDDFNQNFGRKLAEDGSTRMTGN